jgi:hypothetical protein
MMLIAVLLCLGCLGCKRPASERRGPSGGGGGEPRRCTQILERIWKLRQPQREDLKIAGAHNQRTREQYMSAGRAFISYCRELPVKQRSCLAGHKQPLRASCGLSDRVSKNLRREVPDLVSGVHVVAAAAPGKPPVLVYDHKLDQRAARARLAGLVGVWERRHGTGGRDRWTIRADGTIDAQETGRRRRYTIAEHFRWGFKISHLEEKTGKAGAEETRLFFMPRPDRFFLRGGTARYQPVPDRGKFVLDHVRKTHSGALEWFFIYHAKGRCHALDLKGNTYRATCAIGQGEDGETFTAEFSPLSIDRSYTARYVIVDGVFLDHRFTEASRYVRVGAGAKGRGR